jgi:hypothetical protein
MSAAHMYTRFTDRAYRPKTHSDMIKIVDLLMFI